MGKLNVVLAIALGLAGFGLAAPTSAMAQRTVTAPEIDPAQVAPDSVYYEKDWFKYYDQRLDDLDEPSLWQMSKDPNAEAFRFFWLTKDGAPIIVRIDVAIDGAATLTAKRSTGLAGESWGDAKDVETRALSKEELKDLRFRFGYMKYWYVERTDEENVISRPGPVWLFEAIHKGKYHAVERTNPAPGETRKLGLLLLRFIEVDEREVIWPQRPTMN